MCLPPNQPKVCRNGSPVASLRVNIAEAAPYRERQSTSPCSAGRSDDTPSSSHYENFPTLDDLEFSPRSEAIFQREIRKAVAAGAAVNEKLVRSILTQHFEISYESEDEEDVEECQSVEDVEERVFTFDAFEEAVECTCKNAPHFGQCNEKTAEQSSCNREATPKHTSTSSCVPKSSVLRPPPLDLEFSNTVYCPATPQLPPKQSGYRRPQRAARSISPPIAEQSGYRRPQRATRSISPAVAA